MPLSILLVLFLMGLIMLRTNRTRLAAKIVFTITFLILVLLSYGVLSSWPLQKLENIYPPIDVNSLRADAIKWVVVLAGAPEETYVRLTEGIRICRSLPETKLIVSGGKVVDAAPEPSSSKMARIAAGLGVNPTDIVQEDISKDTKDEARIIRSMIHETPFVLVTSAYHMPRSMALFKAQGMHPIPAPTGRRIIPDEGYLRPNWFFPNANNIMDAEIVLHEVLGIISAWTMGQLEVKRP